MGNGAGKLTLCFTGGGGAASMHLRGKDLSVYLTEPLDEGLGHSFCYVHPDPARTSLSKVHSEEAAADATTFWAISGASFSANTSTPLSTSLVDMYSYGCVDKSSTFESSTSFSAIPLQPIPRGLVNSGPLSGGMDRVPGSGQLEKGFLSGPLERGLLSGPLDLGIFSGPLDGGGGQGGDRFKRSFSHGGRFSFRRKGWKGSLMKSIRKAIVNTIYRGQNSIVAPIKAIKEGEFWLSGGSEYKEKNEKVTMMANGGSLNLSSEGSVEDDVQWAQGKAGEDRVHVVVSEEHGWVFVGIYDGFNGPDAPDYLISNLYAAIHKELRGLLWDVEKIESNSVDTGSVVTDSDDCDAERSSSESEDNLRTSVFVQDNYPCTTKDSDPDWRSNKKRNGIPRSRHRGPAKKWEENQWRWKCKWDRERIELDRRLKEQLNRSRSADGRAINHSEVLKALSRALQKTEDDYLKIADMVVFENPELALMGSCVLAVLMKGEDVYVMNVGDSRAVLAQKAEPDYRIGKVLEDLEGIKEESLHDVEASEWDTPNAISRLNALPLTVDHSTDVKEEIQRIKREHPDDGCAIANDRVKGSLKVTRAFGAGFLKQPKWNDALLEMFRIDYVGTSPYISCNPSLLHHKIVPRDRFLILSSDGLYQYFTNEEAVSEVQLFIELQPEGDPAQHLIEEVLFRAAKKAGMEFNDLLEIPNGDRRRYHDDISIIIISLEGRIWRSSA